MMNQPRIGFPSTFQKIAFSEKSIPLALLAAHLLAFGLLLPFLGYYQDDWHYVYYAYSRGARGLVELFAFDGHPLEAWYYILGFWIMGYKPIFWQISSLLWRWLTAVTFWATLRELWPAQKREIFSAALLFSIYPLFSLQSQAIAYGESWFSYFLLCLTFYLMLKAIKTPGRFWQYTLLAVFIKIIQLFASEYFSGLELVRPVLIWLALLPQFNTIKQRLWTTVKIWMPYFIPSLLFILWRLFIFKPPIATHNDASLVNQLLTNPFSTSKYLIVHAIPDIIQILFTSWANIFLPDSFEFTSLIRIAIFLLMAAGFMLALTFLLKLKETDPGTVESTWTQQALALGLLAVVLGMLPAYAAGYFITTENPPWNSRFGMAATFGASLVILSLLNMLVTSARSRAVIVSVFFALSLAWHTNMANNFRTSWQSQAHFYEQLTWRAPSIAPYTALITDQEILTIMGDYPTAFAINAIYARPNISSGKHIPYWYFAIIGDLDENFEEYKAGLPLVAKKFSMRFTAESSQNLLISYKPESGQCLWIVRPEDSQLGSITDLEKSVAPLSTPARISATSADNTLMHVIFDKENKQTWCYFFEKADLARQNADWELVASQWADASRAGFSPKSSYEYFPFIEAYARLDKWETAVQLTQKAYELKKGRRPSLCQLWSNLKTETNLSVEREAALPQIQTLLSCPPSSG